MIDAARTQDEILAVLRGEAKWLIEHDLCFVCLPDKSHSRYVVTILSAATGGSDLHGREFPFSEGLPGVVLETRTPLVADLREQERAPGPLESNLRSMGMSSYLLVPLLTGDGIIGCLAFASGRVSSFGEEELMIARELGTHAAIALANTALLDDATRRIGQIELVNELSEKLTSTLELEDLLRTAAESIRKAFKFSDVSIHLVRGAGNEIVLAAHAGQFIDQDPPERTEQSGIGTVMRAAAAGERVIADEGAEIPGDRAVAHGVPRSELAIPIRIHHEVVGVLDLKDDRPHAFDDTDAIVLETLCDHLGSVLHNAQLYDQLKRTNEKLTELDEVKSNFLGIVSHDFRSPLASIILAARSLLSREAPVERGRMDKYLNVIIDQASKLSALAEDTLSVTRMESGKLKCMFGVVNLDRLIKDAAGQVNFTRWHVLDIQSGGVPVLVKGDQPKLRQVVQNLLSNAVKYSPAGGTVKVRVEEYTPDQFMISVADQGIGIPANQMDRLFRKFSRIETPQVREIKGSGLGLWICKEIVEAHEGRIWAESEVGKGSAFHFTLKKAAPDRQPS